MYSIVVSKPNSSTYKAVSPDFPDEKAAYGANLKEAANKWLRESKKEGKHFEITFLR